MSEITLTSENFEQQVIQNSKTVLVDFWADWCMPCTMLSPIISEIAEETPDITVGKVNIDEQPTLAAQYGISSIPTLMVFRNGKITNKSVGLTDKENIKQMLRQHRTKNA